jgi:hypothetical protein
MTDSGSSNVKDTAEAVKGIVEAVPVYQDAIQPAAQEVGKGLQTVAKTIHIVLAPVSALVWGYEQIENFVSTRVAEKLSNTPNEELIEPKPHVAGPALEALRYTGHEESLRDLYANLLAASMDAKTASTAHPGFVEIIKQLTPDEARMLNLFTGTQRLPILTVHSRSEDEQRGFKEVFKNFSLFGQESGCEHPHLSPSYLDNLARLGLIEIRGEKYYTASDAYEELENHPSIIEIKRQIDEQDGAKSETQKGMIDITNLGEQFIKACVIDHRESQQSGRELR